MNERDPRPTGLGRLAPAAALVFSLAAAGCVETDWWQGGESSITFGWTVNGAPAATGCAPAGGTQVRMWIAQDLPTCTLEAESCGIRDDAWTWECTTGTASTDLRFSAVSLVDSRGTILAWTPWQPVALSAGDNFLGTQDFSP